MENDILQDDILKIPIEYDKDAGFLYGTLNKLSKGVIMRSIKG